MEVRPSVQTNLLEETLLKPRLPASNLALPLDSGVSLDKST